MRAVVHERYGPPEVLRLAEVERPVLAHDGLLVRVHATTVNRTDCAFRAAKPFVNRPFSGLLRPRRRVLGTEFAGEVEAVGAAVTRFAPGDRVFGVNAAGFGAHAEFIGVSERAPVAKLPAGVAFEAALADGAILALSCLRRAGLQPGQRILIYGASGSIGRAAVQLAKHLGAEVTAVCGTDGAATVAGLGADTVIDYTQEDFTAHGGQYEIVFDAVGKTSWGRCKPLLRPGGVLVETDLGFLGQNVALVALTRRRVLIPLPRYTQDNVLLVGELLATGRYRPVIDRRYPLEEVVAATRYVETSQKIGNVVLTVGVR